MLISHQVNENGKHKTSPLFNFKKGCWMKFPKILLTIGILYVQQSFRVTTSLLLKAVQQNLISIDLFAVHARFCRYICFI